MKPIMSKTCENTFFAESDEFFALIKRCESEESVSAMQSILKRVEEILGKYQEQASLLDSHLTDMIAPVMHRIRTVLIDKYSADVRFQQSDPSVVPFTGFVHPILNQLFQIVYLVAKTRGYKHVVRLLPHEVADLEPALQFLLSQDMTDHETWETRYVLFLWLSMLVLVPFDLLTADSLAAAGSSNDIISRIIATCQRYLEDPGPVREAAALCLARLLTRPDLDKSRLRSVLVWCSTELSALSGGFTDGRRALSSSVEARAIGILQVLVEIGKHGHR